MPPPPGRQLGGDAGPRSNHAEATTPFQNAKMLPKDNTCCIPRGLLPSHAHLLWARVRRRPPSWSLPAAAGCSRPARLSTSRLPWALRQVLGLRFRGSEPTRGPPWKLPAWCRSEGRLPAAAANAEGQLLPAQAAKAESAQVGGSAAAVAAAEAKAESGRRCPRSAGPSWSSWLVEYSMAMRGSGRLGGDCQGILLWASARGSQRLSQLAETQRDWPSTA